MGVTAALGDFASKLVYGGLPDEVRERARICVLDAIAVMLGGADFARRNGDRCLESYLRATAPPGRSVVYGYGVRTSPLMAAFGNGTTSEVLDCQDSHFGSLAHSGTPVIPAVLALAQADGLSWGALAPAIVAGYEAHIRLLLAVQPTHWYKGFQGTGTFGTSGAAVAAGHLFGFDGPAMAAALGISGFVMPVSNGDQQFKGHSVKPVHGGQAAMCGLSAAYMAQAGYLAGPLEGEPPRHHAALHIMSDKVDEAVALAELGSRWHMMDVAFKPYPVGHLNVGPVEVALEIRAQHAIRPDDIASIDVRTYKHAVTFTGRRYSSVTSNFVDAHMSMPYCIAVALTDQEMTPRQLLTDRLVDPKVHELAARVTVSEDPAMTSTAQEWPLAMRVCLRNGTVIERRIDRVKWSPLRPPTWDELVSKFHLMADPVIGHAAADRAIDCMASLGESSSLAPLFDALDATC